MDDKLAKDFTVELLDRTHMVAGIFDEYIGRSSALCVHPDLVTDIEEVSQKLWDLYQLIGTKLDKMEN